ncbi:MAG: ribosome small subunit-dependent GTPase A [Bacteroides sp.]|nr:ribosome small subunit-dependent GTPase A [Ruminococcus flavefaciens]MCM1555242.1 ribosome small subunit-dependent GTPase A [Bacteroides sp.]
MLGRVIASTGKEYAVQDSALQLHNCKVKGNFRIRGVKTTNPVAVGDMVEFEGEWITRVEERRNCIIRKSVNLSKQTHIIAANIDLAFLVIGLNQPRTPQGFIDRFLVTGQAYHVPVCLVFNKRDLFTPQNEEEYETYRQIYTEAGYEVMATSALTGEGMEELKARMKDRICLFSGNSGVGKSALIRHLEPSLDIRIGEISETHLKGKHTTTYARMYPLSFGGYIVDTPGIKEFGMVRFTTDELSRYFPEMQRVSGDCRFNNCTHEHEPGCAVKQAVEEGKISPVRYASYLNILHGDEVPEPSLLGNKNDKK